MVVVYACLGTCQVLKRFTQILKRILKVKQSTPSVMLYGDLGRVPLPIRIKKRVSGYWYYMINSDNKLSSIVYRLILQDNVHNGHSYEWLKFVKTISNDGGITYIRQSQFVNGSKHMLLSRIETTILSQFKQKWQSGVNNSSKLFFIIECIKLIIGLRNSLIL